MKVIKLANNETIELKINFLTIKVLKDVGAMKMDFKSEDPEVQIEIASKLIYAILYSCGKRLTMDDALALVPLGEDDAFSELFEEFGKQMEAFEKKTQSRSNLNEQLKR